jgi:hypothetical protein
MATRAVLIPRAHAEENADRGIEKYSNELICEILDYLCEHPSVPRCAEK